MPSLNSLSCHHYRQRHGLGEPSGLSRRAVPRASCSSYNLHLSSAGCLALQVQSLLIPEAEVDSFWSSLAGISSTGCF